MYIFERKVVLCLGSSALNSQKRTLTTDVISWILWEVLFTSTKE